MAVILVLEYIIVTLYEKLDLYLIGVVDVLKILKLLSTGLDTQQTGTQHTRKRQEKYVLYRLISIVLVRFMYVLYVPTHENVT